MSELIKIEDKDKINYSPELSSKDQEIVLMSQTNVIDCILKSHLNTVLIEAISKAILVVGNKNIKAVDVSAIAVQVTEHLKATNKYLKIGEIEKAIQYGSFGEYLKEGEVLFISAANIYKWVKEYQTLKHESLHKQLKFEKGKIEMEEESKKKKDSNAKYWEELPSKIANCIERDKMASIYFENLWKYKLLTLDEEEVRVLKERSKEEAIKRLRLEKKNIVRIGEDNIKSMSNKIAKEKAFYLWLKENEDNDIEKIVREAINKNR